MSSPSSLYPATYYTDTIASPLPKRPRLSAGTQLEADVCVIGGGLSGVATALSLAERGQRVIVLEQHQIGWGASGRNGGQVIPGFDKTTVSASDSTHFINKIGKPAALALYKEGIQCLRLIRSRIAQYKIPGCDLTEGLAVLACTTAPNDLKTEIDFQNETFERKWQFWDQDQTYAHFKSDRYKCSIYVPEGYHIHPLNYVLGLAAAFESLGGHIFEQAQAQQIESSGDRQRITTACGAQINVRHVVFACSGYITGQLPLKLRMATMPINTFVGVSEPLSDELRAASIPSSHMAFDDRNIMNYFRILPDNRVLWGGGAGIFRDPNDLCGYIQRDMVAFFPQLKGVRIEKAWVGTMGCSLHRMPQIGELAQGRWYNMGHCGQGLMTTSLGGELIARAITGQDRVIDLLKPYGLDFTGGTLGKPAAKLYTMYLEHMDRQASSAK